MVKLSASGTACDACHLPLLPGRASAEPRPKASVGSTYWSLTMSLMAFAHPIRAKANKRVCTALRCLSALAASARLKGNPSQQPAERALAALRVEGHTKLNCEVLLRKLQTKTKGGAAGNAMAAGALACKLAGLHIPGKATILKAVSRATSVDPTRWAPCCAASPP